MVDLQHLIEALSIPAAYSYAVENVEIRQTHISAVFLAGPFVYKLKKPVKYEFLDFGSLDKRLHYCEEEVRLNRRLAPDVYLGVVPITSSAAGFQFEGSGTVVEWAVKMRRLPVDGTLLERIERGEVTAGLVEHVARRLAAFHRGADSNDRISSFGKFDSVARSIGDVLDRASRQAGKACSEAVVHRVRKLIVEALDRQRPLIEARAARGMPRDCHGDLHLDHIYVFPELPPLGDIVIIDCIEFSEQFRYIDPVADMAFIIMDFAFHGRRDLGNLFADAYFNETGDQEGRELLPLYTSYRACVRALVDELLLAKTEVPVAERDKAAQRARAHWLLALSEIEAPDRKPCLLLVGGLPGSGKSLLAASLAERGEFHVIRSDVVRKELANLPSRVHTRLENRGWLYGTEWTERTYLECLRRAEVEIFNGNRVLLDATFHEEKYRQLFLKAARSWGIPAIILICEAEPETIRARLEARHEDASDADWNVYLQLAATWEAIGEVTKRYSRIVPSGGSPEQTLNAALDILRHQGLQG